MSTEITDAKFATSDTSSRFAYVMNVQWIGPLVSMDYSAEWNLLWRMGLSQLNPNDDFPDDTPATVQRAIMVNDNPRYGILKYDYLRTYVEQSLKSYRRPMAIDANYFYTIKPGWVQPRWVDQQIMFAMAKANLNESLDEAYWKTYIRGPKDTSFAQNWLKEQLEKKQGFNRHEAERYVSYLVSFNSSGLDPDINPQQAWPDVTVDAAGRATGMFSLSRAIHFTHKHPQQTAWVMSMDAPDFPKDEQASENCALLILASPELIHPFPRKPLATIYNPVEIAVEKPRVRFQDVKKAIQVAADAGKVKLEDVGMFFHDATMGSEASSDAIRSMGQALTELIPGFDFMKETYSVDKYLKNADAASAAMNMAFATAYVHHTGKPAIILANRETDKVYATLVTPPPGHIVPPKKIKWPRAGLGGQAYSPWWGDLIPVDDKKRKLPLKKLIEPRAEANVPLGTIIASGEPCPQSGAWRCTDPQIGGGYDLIREGAPMPFHSIDQKVGVMDKLQGKSSSIKVSTTWELVKYHEEE